MRYCLAKCAPNFNKIILLANLSKKKTRRKIKSTRMERLTRGKMRNKFKTSELLK